MPRPCQIRLAAVFALLMIALPLFAAEPEPALEPLESRLAGVWRQVGATDEAKSETVEITPSFWAVAVGGKLEHRERVLGMREGELVVNRFGNRIGMKVTLEGDTLTVRYSDPKTTYDPEPAVQEKRYERVASRPAFFDVEPLALGDGSNPIADERLQALRAELARRMELDQGARKPFEKPGAARATPEEIQRMREIDADNTAWLIETIGEVDWIDTARFGTEAAQAAFLIVQHSGQLRLMKTALPAIEKDLAARGGRDGSAYALLHDRTHMWLGLEQSYGSQIGFGPEGMFVYPIADPDNVDARRAKLGLEPLAKYLEHFLKRNGDRPPEMRKGF